MIDLSTREQNTSQFVIQVVDRNTGHTVQWAPGRSIERQLTDELCIRVAAEGVGVFRSTKHVVASVRKALHELLYDLKSDV